MSHALKLIPIPSMRHTTTHRERAGGPQRTSRCLIARKGISLPGGRNKEKAQRCDFWSVELNAYETAFPHHKTRIPLHAVPAPSMCRQPFSSGLLFHLE